ncbi:glycine betaine ABC transporter substrate-binding protein [Rhodoferax sp. U11-2br]|uniref:taurine ABC transporter substrate-binding protein n=1 Tax=Rhodoferax sp. U11-2br TaxID=2838878 RepID=UPI001BEA8CC4|nr:glycine betaine ABC transporter substrate-binding protein [Rhodoferax sp. U11-2br]MBT3065587.1 ABC transporter substrate-binding protein [Rhodoferax sp. U11-2br]
MLINRFRQLVGIAVVALSTLSGLAQAQAVPPEVRFAYAGGPRVWILGKIDGAFDAAFGTKVKWIPFASGSDVLTLFAAKEIDIARFGSSPAAAGIARKLPIEVIGAPEIIATSERLIARKNITSLKDLEGKTVAFPANSTAQYAFEVAIKLAKVERSKIKALALKPAEIVAAWKRSDIDAAYVWGPFTQQLEADGGKEIFATRDLQKDDVLVFNNFVVRKEFADKYPEIVVKFLRVVQDKVDQYKKDPDGSAQKIATHLDIPLETARSTLSGLQYPSLTEQLSTAFVGNESNKSGSRITRAYKDTANFLADIGEIRKSDVPESYAPFINTTYLQRAQSGK